MLGLYRSKGPFWIAYHTILLNSIWSAPKEVGLVFSPSDGPTRGAVCASRIGEMRYWERLDKSAADSRPLKKASPLYYEPLFKRVVTKNHGDFTGTAIHNQIIQRFVKRAKRDMIWLKNLTVTVPRINWTKNERGISRKPNGSRHQVKTEKYRLDCGCGALKLKTRLSWSRGKNHDELHLSSVLPLFHNFERRSETTFSSFTSSHK